MDMRALASKLRRQSIEPSELSVPDRVTLAMEIGGRRVQDLVVTLGISRTEALHLLHVRDQLGRSCSPCTLSTFRTTEQ